MSLPLRSMTGSGRRLLPVLCLLSALALGGCGITAPRSSAGFADFDSPGWADTDRRLALSFGPTVLRLAHRHTDDDPGTQAILAGLDGVRVRIYDIDGDSERVAGRLAASSRELEAEGWTSIALVKGDGQQTHMLARSEGGRMEGLVVLATEADGEVVMVNLIGDLRPEHYADAMAALEVDAAPEIDLAEGD